MGRRFLKEPDTDELLGLAFAEPELDGFMRAIGTGVPLPPFSEFITDLASEREEVPERIIDRANLSKSFGHQLFNGRRKPSRDSVLQLAFGFEADYELAQELLKVARKSQLHPRVRRDVVIIYCLQHRYTVVDAQIALDKYGLPLLGSGSHRD